MVSHCTASLKLTPWHEGTFANAVIYSPPPNPHSHPPPPPRPCTTLSPPPSLSPAASKLTFIILSLSSSHSFPAAQELGKTRKRGKKARGGAGKWGTNRPNHSPARFFPLSSSPSAMAIGALLFVTPQAPVENGRSFHCKGSSVSRLSGEIQLRAQGAGCWVRAGGEEV